jgi:Uma2 family endonuclease
MTQVALDPAYRRITVEEFLRMDFGDAKAELVDGVIHMMAGGRRRHNQVQARITGLLLNLLRGSPCQPFGPDQAVRTGPSEIRYADVSVYCGDLDDPDGDDALLIGDPRVVFEVASDTTKDYDQRFKLPEYQSLAGVEAVVLVFPESERVRLVSRTGPESWTDRWLPAGEDLRLDCLAITLPHSEIFGRR